MKFQMFKLVLEKAEEPEIPVTLGEDHWVLNTRLDEVAFALQ